MKRIKTLLSKVKDNTMWGYAINSHLAHGGSVADLIVSLRSQSIDNPKLMKQVIGAELYHLIIKPKEAILWESYLTKKN